MLSIIGSLSLHEDPGIRRYTLYPTTMDPTAPPPPAEEAISRKQACARVIAILLALGASIWCWNTVVRSAMNYSSLSNTFDQWLTAPARIVGSNRTRKELEGNSGVYEIGDFLPYFSEGYFYCTIIKYTTEDGANVTTVMDTRCTDHSSSIKIGQSLDILYDPEDLKDVVEVTVFESSMRALVVATGISTAFALGFFGCFVLLFVKRKTPMPNNRGTRRRTRRTDVESPEEDIEMREAQILGQFLYQTVLEDGSNTTAKIVRSGEVQQEVSMKLSVDESENSLTTANTDTDNSVQSHDPVTTTTRTNACCICMEAYAPGEIICAARTTECDHVFHKQCLASWLQNHNQCPLCRVDLMN